MPLLLTSAMGAHASWWTSARRRPSTSFPLKAIGTNTVTHLQSGLYYGYIGLVDGILERIIKEIGTEVRVISTGGLARQISEDSRYIAEINDMLTLDGLRIVFERNRAARPRTRAH